MTVEFTVRDVEGNVTLDLTRSTTKFLGQRTVSGSGNFNVPELTGRRGWVTISANGIGNSTQFWLARAYVSGTRIYYESARGTYTLSYGLY